MRALCRVSDVNELFHQRVISPLTFGFSYITVSDPKRSEYPIFYKQKKQLLETNE